MQPRGEKSQILILDRTFDLGGPLMHSYSHMSLIEDYMGGNPQILISDEKVAATCFNEEDPYW